MNKIPVTILSGFAGSGKTALAQRLLASQEGRKVASILADLGAGELDNGLCETATPGIVHCKSREHLGLELRKIGRAKAWDHVVIESTGGSEPMPVAECVAVDDGRGTPVSRFLQIDSMITVVDAERFLSDYRSTDTLRDRGLAASSTDARTVAEALVAQVEMADVLVLNKVDRAGAADLTELASMLAVLNPRARVFRAEHGALPLSEVMGQGLFDLDAAREILGTAWHFDHAGRPAQGGFATLAYRRFRPFHPQRFEDLMHGDREGVVRSRGTYWVASRPDTAGEWWQAGKVVRHHAAGSFWAATPEGQWEIAETRKAKIKAIWREPFGDRRQELVLVVRAADLAAVERRLDACLLTDDEMALGPAGWKTLGAPSPALDTPAPDHAAHDHDHEHEPGGHEHAHERFRGHSPAGGHHMQ